MHITVVGLWLLVIIIVILIYYNYILCTRINRLYDKHYDLIDIVNNNAKILEKSLNKYSDVLKEIDKTKKSKYNKIIK